MLTTSYATKIRKLGPAAPPPPYSDDVDSDPDEEPTDKKSAPVGEEEEEVVELPETSDEMARIYWKFFSRDKIVFRGKITNQGEFLPECGKMKG